MGEMDKKTARILVAEDDRVLRNLIRRVLDSSALEITSVNDGLACLQAWEKETFDLVVLDVLMPKVDGLEVCRAIRRISQVPIILLTALGTEQDICNGFEAGADDYLIKPFHPRELAARVQNVLKHSSIFSPQPENRLVYQDLALELRGRQVIREGKAIKISPTEVRLLVYLMQHPGEVVSKTDLLKHVWGHIEICGDLNLVETAVKRLRQKIEADPKNPNIIQTTWGSGYRFNGRRSSQSNWR